MRVKIKELGDVKFLGTLPLFNNKSYGDDGEVYKNGYCRGHIFSARTCEYLNGFVYLWDKNNSRIFMDEYNNAVKNVAQKEGRDYSAKMFPNVVQD